MSNWQPIETAPKDGSEVLLWVNWLDKPGPVLGGWRDGGWMGVGGNYFLPSVMFWQAIEPPEPA